MKWPVPAVRAWLSVLGVFAALLVAITPARAEPARLGVEELIQGMTQLTANWMSQKSWMLHYKHARQPGVSPAKLPDFPEVEVYNARKGSRFYVQDRQELMRSDGSSTGQIYECWASWDGKISVERQSTSVIILPELSARPYQMLYYTGLLDLDLISDMRIRSDDLKKIFAGDVPSKGFWEALPRSVLEHKAEFKVRPQLEVVDGTPCHVLEWPKKDVIWIDATHGFLMRRRIYYQSSGSPLFELNNQDVREKAPGIWLPMKEAAIRYNLDQAPAEFRGKPEIRISCQLIEARFNDVPDSFFEVPIPERALVVDQIRGVTYQKHPEGTDHWETAIEAAKTSASNDAVRSSKPLEIALYVGIIMAAFLLVFQSWRLLKKQQAARPDDPSPSPDAMAGP
jgi:hypothetical protein